MKILDKSSKLFGFQISSLCHGPFPICVAVSQQGNAILVADTKNPNQTPLKFTLDEWKTFIKGAKQGEFDYSNINF